MVKCSCGKAIEKVPAWLESVTVEFVCTNCPSRQVKTIAQLHAEQSASRAEEAKIEDPMAEEDDEEPELD
ncbi:MAG: hypothetical protein J0L72_07990 [Armatimonadetes bacterium]|nr:hypothetical protein [Armatimonadota bacterium]